MAELPEGATGLGKQRDFPKGAEERRHNKLGRELSSRSWRQWEKTMPRLADHCHEHEPTVALTKQRD